MNKDKKLKPKTENQELYIRSIVENSVTFAVGDSGTGKTSVACRLACEHLLDKKIEKIVVTRPLIETGNGGGLGFLPGGLREKINPYLRPILDEFYPYFGKDVEKLIDSGKIELIPLEVMRGYNLHGAMAILDEAANATLSQLKMFLTRIGKNTTMIINGDINQSDLYQDNIPLKTCIDKLSDVEGIGVVEFTSDDIVRNPLIKTILARLEE